MFSFPADLEARDKSGVAGTPDGGGPVGLSQGSEIAEAPDYCR